MADKILQFTVNMNGTAVSGVAELTEKVGRLQSKADKVRSTFGKFGDLGMRLNGIIQTASAVYGKMKEFTAANQAQQEAEAKLARVMHNTMGAGMAEVDAIKELASAQQRLGVIGDEVQLAGAQELGTYLEKTDSLKALIPVMNDMLAQQYGLNASQEQATQIASMMGKVMEGQVGALSRYGYKFDDAQEKLLKYGTEEQRVATLAEVIGQSVGGMNEALAATPEGRIQQVKNDAGDLKERVGGLVVDLESRLMPIANTLLKLANRIVGAVESGWPVVVAATAGVLIGVTKLTRKVQAMSLSVFGSQFSWVRMAVVARASCKAIGTAIKGIPIVGWIAAAISLVVSLFTLLWNKCAAFRGFLTGVWEAIKASVGIVWEFIKTVVAAVAGWVKEKWGKVMEWVRGAVASVKEWINGIKAWVVAAWNNITDWIETAWNNIVGGIRAAIEWVRGAIAAAKEWLDGLPAAIGGIVQRIWERITGRFAALVAWIKGILAKAGAWFASVMQPVWDWFSNLWGHVKGIIDKVVEFMGRVFNPIIELWNKLTGGSVKAFKSGYDKGSSAVKDGKGAGVDLAGLANGPGREGETPDPKGKTGKTESGVTGGNRSTSITINLKSLVEKMVFDGGLAENRGDMQRQMAEALLQVLNMAQSSVG